MPYRNLHHRVFFTVISVFLCACFLQPAVNAQGKSSITITIPQNFQATRFALIDDKIIVQARLNDKVNGKFILDTGGHTSITHLIASRLGLSLTSDQDVTSDTKYSVITEIVLESVELTNVPVQVERDHYLESWNSAHPSEEIIGFLGIDALKQWALGIDFPSHTLGWWKGGKIADKDVSFFSSVLRYPENIKGALLILSPGKSITMSGKTIVNKNLYSTKVFAMPLISKPDYDQVFVHASINGQETELAWDTGANIISIPEMLAKGLHPLFRKHATGESADHRIQADVTILSTLTLGDLSIDLPFVGIVPHAPFGQEKDTPADIALLGLNPFTDCRIIMDFPGKVLYLSPYIDYNRTVLQRLKHSGIALHHIENGHDLLAVFPGSPAFSSGVKDGDELLAIDGQPIITSQSSLDLSSRRSFVLSVKRKGTKKSLEFVVPTPK
ncbi:MAG: hypothetical protein JWL77_2304 [Chthonomonadaceae bacterium]|nr:hypothetical protein [Chthonomonadaceae bacterium]